jgi:hypothetical protein
VTICQARHRPPNFEYEEAEMQQVEAVGRHAAGNGPFPPHSKLTLLTAPLGKPREKPDAMLSAFPCPLCLPGEEAMHPVDTGWWPSLLPPSVSLSPGDVLQATAVGRSSNHNLLTTKVASCETFGQEDTQKNGKL